MPSQTQAEQVNASQADTLTAEFTIIRCSFNLTKQHKGNLTLARRTKTGQGVASEGTRRRCSAPGILVNALNQLIKRRDLSG